MPPTPGTTIEEIMDFWKDGWEGRKAKMEKKGGQSDVQKRWRDNASSEGAEKGFAEKVKKAIEDKARMKGIQGTDPKVWGDEYVAGVRAKTLTEGERLRFGSKAGPYIGLVQRVRVAYRASGLHGIEGGKFWLQEIAARLEKARRKPEIIPSIETEIMSVLRAKARELGVTVAI